MQCYNYLQFFYGEHVTEVTLGFTKTSQLA